MVIDSEELRQATYASLFRSEYGVSLPLEDGARTGRSERENLQALLAAHQLAGSISALVEKRARLLQAPLRFLDRDGVVELLGEERQFAPDDALLRHVVAADVDAPDRELVGLDDLEDQVHQRDRSVLDLAGPLGQFGVGAR